MRKSFIFILLFLISISAYTQHKISGTVTAEDGTKLSGSIVTVNRKAVVTNEEGFYEVTSLMSAIYLVECSFVGYKSQDLQVSLVGNKTVDFVLKVDYSKELENIVVSGTRANEKTPVAYTNIGGDEIEKANLGQDITYLLKLTPSLVVSSDAGTGVGYSQFKIRGTDMSRINVTLNGVPLNDSESHGVWWVNIPDFASSVNNIQVQRGVGTSTNGASAFGASVNLMTTSIEKKAYGEISNTFGSFNTRKHTVRTGTGLINDHFTFDTRLSKISSDGYIDRAWSDLKSYYVSGAYHGKHTLVRAIIFSGLEETYQAWNGVPKVRLENDTEGMQRYLDHWLYSQKEYDQMINSDSKTYNLYTYENEIDHYEQSHFQLVFAQKIVENLSFNATLHYTKGGGYYEQFKEDEDLEDYSINPIIIINDTINSSNLIRRKWLDNHFYGVTYALNYSNKKVDATLGGAWNKYEGSHFGNVIWMQYAGDNQINKEWYRSTGDKTDFNIFAKINYQIIDKINLFADVQYRQVDYEIKGIDDDLRDIFQNHSFPFFNPKGGLMFNFNDNQKAYFSFAIANREPKRSDFTDAKINTTPTFETLYDYEFGYELNTEKFIFNTNLYYMDYKNQLIMNGEINDVGSPIMINVPESYRAGVEFVAGINLFNRVDWQANMTYSQNVIQNFTEYIDNWDYDYWNDEPVEPSQIEENVGDVQIPFSPSIIASNMISVKITKPFSIDFITKYVGKQEIYAGKEHNLTGERKDYLDLYLVNDVRLNLNFKTKYIKEINFNFQINNVLSEEYESFAWAYRYYYGGEHYTMDGYFPQAKINFMGGLVLKF